MIPDKIYLHRTFHLGMLSVTEIDITGQDEQYIRKDALLKYLRNEFAIVDSHLKGQDDPVWWGQRNAFRQVIDKIESI